MSEWRPEGWENPSTEESLEAHGWRLDKTTLRWLKPDGDGHDLIPYDVSVERRYAYEAGADAMLAALKGAGTTGEFYFNKIGEIKCSGAYANGDTPLSLFREGTVIFIPDEKDG